MHAPGVSSVGGFPDVAHRGQPRGHERKHSLSLKDRIIHESIRLFSLKGFAATSIDDILRQTNASKGGFYNHFKSKDDLFLAVLKEAQRIWRERVLQGMDQIDSPLGQLKQLLNNYANNYLKDPENIPGGCVFLTLSVELSNQNQEHASKINDGFVALKGMVYRLINEAQKLKEIRQGVDTKQVAEVLFSGILGTSVIHALNRSEVLLDRSVKAMVGYLEDLQE